MKHILVAIIAILTMAFVGCTSETLNDADIIGTVKGKLAINPNTSAIKIGVDAVDGVVTLTGVVPTEKEKNEAERVAKATPGVRSVVNNISINPDSIGATNVGQKVEQKTEEAIRNTGAAITDAAILARIKAQFVANGIVRTDVDVNKGEVTLKGEVESNNEKKTAEEIARKIEGVKSVKNLLTVKKS